MASTSRNIQSRSSPLPKWLFGIAIVWISVNFLLVISLQEHLSRLIEPNLPRNDHDSGGADADESDVKSSSTSAFDSSPKHFSFDRKIAEDALQKYGRDAIFQPLRAYLEKPLNDTVPGTIDKGNLMDKKPKSEVGRPPKWYVPLPLREGTPDELRVYEYGHKLRSCNDMPAKLPIDRGLGNHIAPNVNNKKTFSKDLDRWEEAKEGSPVMADPFLPWIHDMFPDSTGSVIHLIAQNKRRCNSGKVHWEDIHALEPQVTIMQPVSVKRIDENTAQKLAPELWSDGTSNDPRYRLAPHEEADADGMFTRFICRFKVMDYSKSPPALVTVGETLSTYPYNYEFVNYRKEVGDLSMLTPKGKDNAMFWQAQQRFDCPTPNDDDLRSMIASGEGVLSDGTPSMYLDFIPIRTAPRYGKRMSYFTPDMAGETIQFPTDTFGWGDLAETNVVHVNGSRNKSNPSEKHPPRLMKNGFNARLFWGDSHVVPRVEASGRWQNLPICKPPAAEITDKALVEGQKPAEKKKHKLAACLWASASFTTRGNAQAVSDTTLRLIEWIEFHLLVGFDHIYVYDNTGAHTDEASLESTLFPRFLETEVTRIDWPCRVCNNNIPAHENTGERSSQYAAENSCRARYGPSTEWIASFDTDEYLVPMGDYNSMREVVDDATKDGTQILTFRSTRAIPIHTYMEPFHDHKDCGTETDPTCLSVKPGHLFSEVYNCEFVQPPKPSWSERAKKQLYRSDYVLAHYVHYATVTQGLVETLEEAKKSNHPWAMHFRESREADRITDESHQAIMMHTKTTVPEYTTEWKKRCELGFKPPHGQDCRVGFPWPSNNDRGSDRAIPSGQGYNCFTNEKMSTHWLPKLRDAMEKRKSRAEN